MPHKPSHPKGCLGDLGDCPPTFIFSPMRCRHGADPVAMAFLVLGYSASRMRRVTPPLRRPCAWLGGLSDEIARLVPKRCVRTDQAHGREGVVEDNGLTKGAKTSEFWVAVVRAGDAGELQAGHRIVRAHDDDGVRNRRSLPREQDCTQDDGDVGGDKASVLTRLALAESFPRRALLWCSRRSTLLNRSAGIGKLASSCNFRA